MTEQKKLKFEDLQPHVDMLCDALENKGASPSGIPHNKEVATNAERYRELLRQIRSKNKSFEDLVYDLHLLNHQTLQAAGDNQSYRINKIVHALDVFIMKEYNRVNNAVIQDSI
jgi:L-arabinose isomerase